MRQTSGLWTWALLAPCVLIPACIGPPLVIEPEQLANAVEGTSYSAALSTDGDALRWTVDEGSLPPGLVLDEETGEISGRPTVPGTYDFTVSVEDPRLPRRTGQRSYSITVIERLWVQFAPGHARVGVPYEYTPQITGGVPPRHITIVGLPAYLDYDRATGRIFGTLEPIEGVVYPNARLLLTATDSGDPQQTATATATLAIHPLGVTITTTALGPATVGTKYTASLQATYGKQPYRWEVVAGVLPGSTSDPDRLHLDPLSGVISGTPGRGASTQTFTIQVTDSDSPASTDEQEFKLVMPVVIVTDTLLPATVGQAYSAALGAIAGTKPYTWQVSQGQLPAGLELNPETGVISGVPQSEAATQTFSVTVTDDDSPPTQQEKELTIQVGP